MPVKTLKRQGRATLRTILALGGRPSVIITTFVVIALLVLLIGHLQVSLLSSLRAYIAGESLWSKAQKQGIQALTHYALSRRDNDYQAFLEAMKIPLGDRQAREELERPNPDYEKAFAGFVQGGNHPSDVAGMINLFRWLRHERFVSEAIGFWTQGDLLIGQLNELAERLHEQISSGQASEAEIYVTAEEIRAIDPQITPMEEQFSKALGDGTRFATALSTILSAFVSACLVGLGILLSWRLLRSDVLERDREARTRAILDTALDAILSVDENGLLVDLNPAAEKMFGRRHDEVVGKPMAPLLVPPELYENHRRGFESVMSGARSVAGQRFEVDAMRADGNRFPIELAITITPRAGRQLFTAFIRDISERRQAEVERTRLLELERQARDQAESANRAKDGFLASVSHELRAPLGPIIGWTQILRDEAESRGEPHEALDSIEHNARWQLRLVEDLLDVARLNSGKLRLEPCPCDLRTISETSIEVVRLAALTRRISIGFDCALPTVPVFGDPQRLQQVVCNLLSNSIKFTPEGGNVEVTVGQIDGHARLKVRDTGIGIDPSFLPHVFERFQQADPGSASTKGLGLGLAIVRDLVHLHGGSIQAESHGLGQGAAFLVTLPASNPLPTSNSEPQPTMG